MQSQNLGDYAKQVVKDFTDSKTVTGRTYSVRYGRTVNLGHYESCRIELEQQFDEATPQNQALQILAGRVEEWAENRKRSPLVR